MTQQKTSADYYWMVSNRSVTISTGGDSKTIMKEDKNYSNLVAAIKEGRWDDIPALLTPEVAVAAMSDGDMRVVDGQVYVKNDDGTEFQVPTGLNATIITYINEQLPFKPLVAFAKNLSKNPSYRSVQQLFSFLEKNNFTITEEGKFIAYKSVREDFKDVHSGKFDNSIGNVVSMPRNQVNEDPEQTCSYGLHVANYDYAHNIYAGPVTLFVEVNPKDVVAVPVDYNNAKMRVCEYKVLGLSKGEIKAPLYSPVEDADLEYPDLDSEESDDYDSEDDCCCCGEKVEYGWTFCPCCGEPI
ncbi:MAG TPA: hypothetical protein VM577_21190 [Anaerovoracaceae bacterium]|nr:hypothetical protein [Anaerovoracaceae bacterium]